MFGEAKVYYLEPLFCSLGVRWWMTQRCSGQHEVLQNSLGSTGSLANLALGAVGFSEIWKLRRFAKVFVKVTKETL